MRDLDSMFTFVKFEKTNFESRCEIPWVESISALNSNRLRLDREERYEMASMFKVTFEQITSWSFGQRETARKIVEARSEE